MKTELDLDLLEKTLDSVDKHVDYADIRSMKAKTRLLS